MTEQQTSRPDATPAARLAPDRTVLVAAVTVAVASGFFDGGCADERLTGSQGAVQMVLVAGLVAVAALGARRFFRALRVRA